MFGAFHPPIAPRFPALSAFTFWPAFLPGSPLLPFDSVLPKPFRFLNLWPFCVLWLLLKCSSNLWFLAFWHTLYSVSGFFDLRSVNIAGRMPETGKVAKMPANSGIQKSNSSHLSHCDSVGHALSVIINSVAKGKPVKWTNNFVRNIEVIISVLKYETLNQCCIVKYVSTWHKTSTLKKEIKDIS